MLALMGHMSRAMLERCSHIRMAAKREAVASVTLRPELQKIGGSPCESPCSNQVRADPMNGKLLIWLVGPVGFEPTTNGL
jgi:hypothetical protein